MYSNNLDTRQVYYSNGRFVFGCQMVWYLNGGWIEKSLIMVQNVLYLSGPPSHVTLPFEYSTPILSGIQMNPVFMSSVFRWLLYFITFLRYTDEIHFLLLAKTPTFTYFETIPLRNYSL